MYNTDPSKLWDLPLAISNIAQWHHSRNLVEGSDDPNQMLKLVEELGELAGNVARGRDIRDDVGDMLVVLTNICERNGVTLSECARIAYTDIKDRKGKMVNGVFVKEEDLVGQSGE
ncbi:putative transcriptional repressor [Salinivibrio phage CW02]|uniref:Putative transcriptional repressor n=1 Tax=Salinivibrio phage CW02 TaxID=1161935 RepID=H9D1F5_9CAUD|nr:MazG-like pyrophosphatase [Salinivibrio phage CW02]AFE86197.1 putative transcriptional repressor [Salinivibrio phage CW02]